MDQQLKTFNKAIKSDIVKEAGKSEVVMGNKSIMMVSERVRQIFK